MGVKPKDLEDKINNCCYNKKNKHNVEKNSSNNITGNMLRAIERILIKKLKVIYRQSIIYCG